MLGEFWSLLLALPAVALIAGTRNDYEMMVISQWIRIPALLGAIASIVWTAINVATV